MPEPTPIGVAVVEHEGRYLVGVRPEGKPLAGDAEFPGGKCAPGEPPADCAVRECLEETGVAVEPVRTLASLAWDYPHGAVALHFVLCRPSSPAAEPFPPFRWTAAAALPALRFPDANAELVRTLAGRRRVD